jgi:arginyl-tRNA synthetase
MRYAIDRVEDEVRATLLATGMVPAESIELVTPKANVAADLAFPTFRLARERGAAPPEVARELAARLTFDPWSAIASATAAGPYVNLTLHAGNLAAAVLQEVRGLGPRYGHDDLGAGRTVVIDYSSPNVAKRMHIGHIRSTIIGQALVNVLGALGYRTIGDNHLGDWGKSFGVLLVGLEREGYPEGEGEDLLAAIEGVYARTSALAASAPAVDQAARDWSLRLEQGDPRARAIWQRAVDLTLRANQINYDRLGVRFDHAFGESFYEPMLAGVIADALASGVAHRDDNGAVVVDPGDGLPTFLLQRSDGGTLYHTRDAATVKIRVESFHPAAILYVIGEPQSLYLRQLFALARALGYVGETELIHVAFGTVFDGEGQPLSTRRGNMVYLQTLLNEGHARARAIVDRAGPDLPEEERDAIAEAVGVGAVIYNDLYQSPKRNMTLDWDRMLALDGNSAPYIQYMHARCRSLLRRAAFPDDWPAYDPALLTQPAEVELVKRIAKLPAAVRAAGAEYAPSEIATWCYETARALAGFYRDCRVMDAESAELRTARLCLVAATAQSLTNGLHLLGIRAPERL